MSDARHQARPSTPPAPTLPPPVTLAELAGRLGVSVDALEAQGTHRGEACWRTPERDAQGNVIGHALRLDKPVFLDGKWTSKISEKGGKRGLTMGWPLSKFAGNTIDDRIIIVEGGSDQATGHDLGMATIGRPSATGGRAMLRTACNARHVCIIGENDKAGRDGAEQLAAALHGVAASVKVIFPPAEAKDLRAWKTAGLTGDDLRRIIEAAPQWTAPASQAENKVGVMLENSSAPGWSSQTLRGGGSSEAEQYNLTDAGNGARFAHQWRHVVRFDAASQRWRANYGKRWIIDECDIVMRLAKKPRVPCLQRQRQAV